MKTFKFWALIAGVVLMAFAGVLFTMRGFTDNPWYFAAAPLYVIFSVSFWRIAAKLRRT